MVDEEGIYIEALIRIMPRGTRQRLRRLAANQIQPALCRGDTDNAQIYARLNDALTESDLKEDE